MAYSQDMRGAARRHLEAADKLAPGNRRDVAGYLFGISAECAIKAMMLDIGLRPLDGSQRRKDPFYAHFPDLRSALRDTLGGRRAAPLATFILSDKFMRHWSTEMRYSNGKDIDETWVAEWGEQARQAVASIGT